MSQDEITLIAQKRDLLGKKVKQLRDAGLTPAVIHERGKDSLYVSFDSAVLKKVYSTAGKHHAIKVDVDGKKYTTIVKEVVNAPASASFYHAVFQAIKDDEKVTAEIPIKLSEDIPAERASLLVLKNMEYLTVEALPKNLIDSVQVDASVLVEAGDKIHVSDVKLSSAITIKDDPESVIASVEKPKDQIAEADAALEEQAAAEGTDVDSEDETAEDDKSESEDEAQPADKKETEN